MNFLITFSPKVLYSPFPNIKPPNYNYIWVGISRNHPLDCFQQGLNARCTHYHLLFESAKQRTIDYYPLQVIQCYHWAHLQFHIPFLRRQREPRHQMMYPETSYTEYLISTLRLLSTPVVIERKWVLYCTWNTKLTGAVLSLLFYNSLLKIKYFSHRNLTFRRCKRHWSLSQSSKNIWNSTL